MTKVALITGITGQDGSYLAELLLAKGYEVHGVKRRSSLFNTARIDHIYEDPHNPDPRLNLHYGDLSDSSNLTRILSEVRPDEVYNLAAQSHVAVSFESPEYTADVDALGTLRLLEAIRFLNLQERTRFYQASTSELYGQVAAIPQSEGTPFHPRSPYAVAKLYAYWITVNYREAYNIYACNGLLFNHESPRRGETFVTRKITRGLARITEGLDDCLYMGNMSALRDWGHARDYVEMQWLMLQQDQPQDFVIASGKQHSVREFIQWAALDCGFEIAFEGEGVDELGVVAAVHDDSCQSLSPGDVVVRVDPKYFRPAEVETLLGDASKAREELGWKPQITAREMCPGNGGGRPGCGASRSLTPTTRLRYGCRSRINNTARGSGANEKIRVTGGAGFIGSHLCESLLNQGHEVLCLDNYFTGSKRNIVHLLDNPYFELLRHDVCFPLYVEVDEIYNLACPASPVHYQHDPVQTTKTSVHGAINMLGLAKRIGAKILQASTKRGLRRSRCASAAGELLGQRQPHRPTLLL